MITGQLVFNARQEQAKTQITLPVIVAGVVLVVAIVAAVIIRRK